MFDGGKVYPNCRNASNPVHECSEYCFKVIAGTKPRTYQSQSGTGMGPEFKACVNCTGKCFSVHGNKGDASPVINSFVTVMSGDEFSNYMELPPTVACAVSLADQFTFLEDSLGRRWNIAISSMDDSFAFRYGWNAFASDHNLQLGNILVFTYIKGSHFAVKIYDNSGCELNAFEINQKTRKRDDRDSIFKRGWCYATDKSCMSKDGSGTCGCSNAGISKQLDEVSDKVKTPNTTQFTSNCDDRNEAGSINSTLGKDVDSTAIPSDGSELERTLKSSYVNVKREEPSDIPCTVTSEHLFSTLPVISEENEEAISATSARATKKGCTSDGSGGDEGIPRDQRFRPDLHPTFAVTMQDPSYLKTALKINITFTQKYIYGEVYLQIPNGSTWPVICDTEGFARFHYRGWIKFAADNVLQVGDTCVFEMIEQQPGIKFLVHIIRALYATKSFQQLVSEH